MFGEWNSARGGQTSAKFHAICLKPMRHTEIRWNPELEEWFCIRCGQTSDHLVREDAQAELELIECELPISGLPEDYGTD